MAQEKITYEIDLSYDIEDKHFIKMNNAWFNSLDLLIKNFKKDKSLHPKAVPPLFRKELENLFDKSLSDEVQFIKKWIVGPKKPIYKD